MDREMYPLSCNAAAREELGCDADDGLPCGKCLAEANAEAAYWLGQWNKSTYLEKHGVEKYEAELRDAGRKP